MDNAIDYKGRKVDYRNAIKGQRYLCPYCMESLNVRMGRKPCFAHMPIKERTPLQRTCPEYNENESNYGKIENISDIVYIDNGGVPLYLCNDGNKFELRAHFPSISEGCKNSLDRNTKVIIDDKEWCYIENINYYPVYDIKKWINISLNPQTSNNEIKRKWLWGIRGIDIKRDIYYAYSEGGYRLAIKSNIYVNEVYRMIFFNSVPYIDGIKFKNIGEIQLKDGVLKKIFYVYEMIITKYNEESREFIESKGYNLIEKVSKITPLWPPAIFNGNELTFDNDKAWFYHSKKSDNEYLYEINYGRMFELSKNNIVEISNISSINEKAIVVTNKIISEQRISNSSAEIKYRISYKQNLNDKVFLKPEISIKNTKGNTVDFNDYKNINKNENYTIDSNILINMLITKDDYCIYSSTYNTVELSHGNELIIDYKGFGNKIFIYNKKNENTDTIDLLDWEIIYKQLSRCIGGYVNCSYKDKILLYKIRNNINKKNIKIYNILYGWIYIGKIPYDAKLIINKIEKRIFND